MRAHSFIVVAATFFGLAALAGCGAEAPLFPTYSHDVQPILEAHCVRCHGAGGMMNGDPDALPVPKGPTATQTPRMGDLTSFMGAKTSAALFPIVIDTYPMPPPPSDPLDSYDRDTLLTWAMNPQP